MIQPEKSVPEHGEEECTKRWTAERTWGISGTGSVEPSTSPRRQDRVVNNKRIYGAQWLAEAYATRLRRSGLSMTRGEPVPQHREWGAGPTTPPMTTRGRPTPTPRGRPRLPRCHFGSCRVYDGFPWLRLPCAYTAVRILENPMVGKDACPHHRACPWSTRSESAGANGARMSGLTERRGIPTDSGWRTSKMRSEEAKEHDRVEMGAPVGQLLFP